MTAANGTTNGSLDTSGAANSLISEGTKPVTSIQLQGKVIAITGANRGIGLGIANSCLDNGAKAV